MGFERKILAKIEETCPHVSCWFEYGSLYIENATRVDAAIIEEKLKEVVTVSTIKVVQQGADAYEFTFHLPHVPQKTG